jgi:hypothetical protein
LILIFVFDFFVGKNFTMRTNNTVAHSSRGRTIIPMEAAIAGAASRRGKGNGARGSRGGGGAATAPRGGGAATAPRGGRGAATAPRGGGAVIAPRGGRARRLEFISVEEGLQQPQEDTYDRDEEEENVAEAHENDDDEEDGEQPALWLRGPAGLPPLLANEHEKWVIEPSGDK